VTGKSTAKAASRTSTASAKSRANGKSATSKTKSAKTTKAFAGKGRTLAEMASDGSDYTGSGASDSDASVGGSDDEDAGDDVDMAEEDFGALDDDETRIMTMMEMKRRRREDRKAYNKGMESIRKEEAKMKKKLGRKLTNGEKNIIRLVKVSYPYLCLSWSVCELTVQHHPELDNVWGDLAATVPPVKPEVMDAHPALKLTLLPFQKESLFWMRKQEEGVWKGGMLADEMGMGKTYVQVSSSSCHLPVILDGPADMAESKPSRYSCLNPGASRLLLSHPSSPSCSGSTKSKTTRTALRCVSGTARAV
jgi:DNA repair protein RAD16